MSLQHLRWISSTPGTLLLRNVLTTSETLASWSETSPKSLDSSSEDMLGSVKTVPLEPGTVETYLIFLWELIQFWSAADLKPSSTHGKMVNNGFHIIVCLSESERKENLTGDNVLWTTAALQVNSSQLHWLYTVSLYTEAFGTFSHLSPPTFHLSELDSPLNPRFSHRIVPDLQGCGVGQSSSLSVQLWRHDVAALAQPLQLLVLVLRLAVVTQFAGR